MQSNLKSYNVYFKCVFWRQFGRILILYTKEVWYLLWPCFSFWCVSGLPKPKEQPFHFIKKQFLSVLDFVHWEMNIISYPIKRLNK